MPTSEFETIFDHPEKESCLDNPNTGKKVKGKVFYWQPRLHKNHLWIEIDRYERRCETTLVIGPDLRYSYKDSVGEYGPLHPLELVNEFDGEVDKYIENGVLAFKFQDWYIEWNANDGFVCCVIR